MNSINENLKLKILKGSPILLEKTNCFFIHRTISEIIDFDYVEFLRIIQLFVIPNSEIQKTMPVPGMTTFLYFLLTLNNNTDFSLLIQKGLNFFLDAENISVDMEKKIIIFSYHGIDNIELNEDGFNG